MPPPSLSPEKGKSGRLSRRPQQAHPAATVDDFRTGAYNIAASVLWMWFIEGQRPDRWDLAGTAVCLAGAAIILGAPRGG